jgi:hypothetical protein
MKESLFGLPQVCLLKLLLFVLDHCSDPKDGRVDKSARQIPILRNKFVQTIWLQDPQNLAELGL